MPAVPLDLNDRSVNPFGDRAQYRQLADVIRDQLKAGRLRPGDALPSEGDIEKLTRMSRTTVREAINILTAEGLVIKRSGAATRVATPPPVRHMATSRYAAELARLRAFGTIEQHPLVSAFTEDHAVAWDDHRVEATYVEDAATADDAARLDTFEGTAVLRRQLIKYVADQPVQIQESVIPLDLVVDTPVMDPARQPWPGGTIAELFSVDLVATKVVEEVSARTPTTAERRQLEMAAAGPVFDITRVFFADVNGEERPVEASVVVVPAARTVLLYETDLRT